MVAFPGRGRDGVGDQDVAGGFGAWAAAGGGSDPAGIPGGNLWNPIRR